MDPLQSVIMGIVQGFTEFLPVSSSGHLALLQNYILKTGEIPLFYDVMLHVGTLIAVFIVLWPEITALLRHPIKNKLGMLILASLPAAAVVLVMKQLFPTALDDLTNGAYLAYGFFATSVVLVLCELIARRYEKGKEIELPQAMAMGAMQAVATVLPGLSRSGSTIAGGLFAGAGREAAAKYAFLMSIPAILGSTLFTGLDVAKTGMGDVSVVSLVMGVAAAAISGFLAIKFMLAIISKHKLYGFAIYTAALGAVLLIGPAMGLW